MKQTPITFLVTLLCIGTITSTIAQANWDGDIEGGQVLTGENKGTRLRLNFSNNEQPLTQKVYLDWVRGDKSGNSYELGYAPRFSLTKKTYAFGETSIKTSSIQDIDQQVRVLAGLGLQIINLPNRKLFAEVSASRVSTQFDTINSLTVPSSNLTQATINLGAIQTLSNLIKFEMDASYATAENSNNTNLEAGISIRVPGGAIKYSQHFRSSTVGSDDPVEVSDSSVSFNYGF